MKQVHVKLFTMHIEDTIAAISTPVGHSGIGIVRLSGKNAVKIADGIFRSKGGTKLKHTPSHRIIFGRIVDPANKETVDEVLVSIMTAPNTYTREDVIEINCHGGAISLQTVLELVLKKGARLADPGEFTQRAFLNGRIDLAQAEATLDIINSLTKQSRKVAVEQLRGKLSAKMEAIREKLTELAAFVETYIDFPEEDIETPSLTDMKKRALGIHQSLRKLIDSSRYGMILRDGLKTTIIGRPNVGKSSLLNALLEHDRAIVTEAPGTTRDVIEEYLNIRGLPVKIMDTAGIRNVKDIAEKEGIKRSIRAMKEADLVLVILDGSRALHDTDMELIKKSNSKNTILVINKADLEQKLTIPESIFTRPTKGKNKRGREDVNKITVKISAAKGTGLDKLKDKIVETALSGQTGGGSSIITNTRHVHALEKALLSVDSFITGVMNKISPEFLSVELREALDAIGEILGITTPEDILDRIFSNFCIGK